ncbi:hypothetical protein AT959_00445 [Dechloromonas denitrificans]|uniref:Response regulatory domain-containing protein n=1 Tax=Dechloromonas denitrificans TaxID=281362 RepID=A0A133XP38_9RHOO|nr:response regulator transcription factor [Dechloromonas denitrificans]KXB32706.1 hypothetical protein AT959_00445 [Dechloromonas denitrificans]
MKHRILLADDHALFRNALRMSLEILPDMAIVGEARDGESVIETARQTRPDVVCLDITMPGPSCTETIQQLLATDPSLKIIAMSAYGDLFLVARMVKAGALAFVTKMDIASQLPAAIQSVSQNRIYFSADLGISDVAELAPYAPTD